MATLRKNVYLSITQTIISAALYFLLFKYVVNQLGVQAVGLWSFLIAFGSFYKLADLGLGQAITMHVAQAMSRETTKEARTIVETATTGFIAVVLILFPTIQFISPSILKWAVEPHLIQEANTLFPYILLSFTLSFFSTLWLSGLDGLNRIDIRSIINIFGQLILLIISITLVPDLGLLGLALAQVGQSTIVALLSWANLRRELNSKKLLPLGWSSYQAKKIAKYGLGLQVGSISMLLFDPLTRAFLSKFGSISLVAYFELANQVVIKGRSLLVSANQSVIPIVASNSLSIESEKRSFYIRNFRLTALSSMLLFGTMFATSGIVSYVVFGKLDVQFLWIYEVVLIGWFLNSLNIPSYFFNLGTGDIRPNSYSSLLISSLNFVLGWTLGELYRGDGVVVAYSTSLLVGSLFLVNEYGARNEVNHKRLITDDFKGISTSLVAVAIVSHLAWKSNTGGIYALLLLTSTVFLYICCSCIAKNSPRTSKIFFSKGDK